MAYAVASIPTMESIPHNNILKKRQYIEYVIEYLVQMLDIVDGDPDLEPDNDREDNGDTEENNDAEPNTSFPETIDQDYPQNIHKILGVDGAHLNISQGA